ncbi:MAG: xylulokinase [Clostridiales bacterium]|nr:xylulokinase [Clostridiales bacterium]
MTYLLGVDLGTSGTKTVLFDKSGAAVASATVEYPLYQPRNGWAEQDPNDWWNAARETIRKVLSDSGVDAADVKGLGISGQMHGLVLLDENGEPLRKAILWCDGRTQAECDEITEKVGKERLIAISANPALTGFTAGKILWVRKNEPEIYAKVSKMMLPKDYVRYKLTGEYYCEMSDGSGTNLLDVKNRCWSGEILEKLDINPDFLPRLLESSDKAGVITAEAARETGLQEGMAVAAGAADNMAAAIGTGVCVPGKAFTTIGTSGVVFAHSKEVQIDPAGRVHTFCSAVPGEYTVMSCTLAAGLSLKWFRDTFCKAECETADGMGVDPYVLMNQQADQSPIGANRLIFLPYLMGERSPILDSASRGAFIGLSAIHQKHDLLRAVMEGVMYSQRQNLDVLRGMHVVPESMLACGGGAKSPFWRQMMADMFDMPVKTVHNTEGPALGAAILAGVASGVYEDIPTACANVIRENDPLLPDSGRHEAYETYYQLYCTLYPALKGAYGALQNM